MSWLLGLRGRLSAALLALSALTLAIAATFLLVPLDRQLRNDALDSLAEAGQTAASGFDALAGADFRPRGAALQRAARDLSRRSGADVAVVDADGRALVATDADPGQRFPDGARAIRDQRLVTATTTVGEEGEAQVAVPLRAGGGRYALALRKSLDDLSAAQSVVRRSLLVSALLALAVALLAGTLLASRLVRRVTALRDTALRVAEQGPVAEVPADATRDEVGDLTRAFATMQQHLREQEQARRTFVATASHELRTPLASLRLMLSSAGEELDRPDPDLPDTREQIARALTQTERLGRLAAELLDLSRLDAGLPVRSELVELVELARSVLAEFADGIPFKLDAPEPVWALADPGGAAQILRVLLDNAQRHSPPGETVWVGVAAIGGRATVTVSDAGPGVVAEDAERIFERFERGSDLAPGDGGFGLGLAIGRELAHRMGGELVLLAPGPGARFALRLPGARA